MNSVTILVIITFVPLGLCETWYKGCYNVTDKSGKDPALVGRITTQNSVSQCARYCHLKRVLLMGVQIASIAQGNQDGDSESDGHYISSNLDKPSDSLQLRCLCIDAALLRSNTTCNGSVHCIAIARTLAAHLPVSKSADVWAVYASEGPYLTQLVVDTDTGVAILDQPVAIEIRARRASAINVTADDAEVGHMLDIVWTIKEDRVQHKEQLSMGNFTQILYRPKYTFTAPGLYNIDVQISNAISNYHTRFPLRVVLPNPRGLQVWIQDEADLPSCIPEEYGMPETRGQLFSVFVGTPMVLAAGVSMGANMTFVFDFDDMFDVITIQACGSCTSVTLEHTFEDTGIYGLKTVVRNTYGRIAKSVKFLVMDRQLRDLTIELETASSSVASVGEQIHFIVSMVTTSRYNHSLQVWYGDGKNNIFSLTDIDSPKLVLAGDGKEMDIVASYGEGCQLLVEFQYGYNTLGYYKPTVALYRDVSNDYLGLDELTDTNNTMLDESASISLQADLVQDLNSSILVLPELTDLIIHAPSVLPCKDEAEIQVLLPTRFNVSIQWTIYKMIDEMQELDYDTSTVTADIDNGHVDYMDDFHIILNKSNSDTKLNYVFNQTGMYLITVKAANAISSVENEVYLFVQCPIYGLQAKCMDDVIITGEELICYAQVEYGSHVQFQWDVINEDTMSFIQSENYTSIFRHRFTRSGVYDIELKASNHINSTIMLVKSSIFVEDIITDFKVLMHSRHLVGKLINIIALYEKPNLYSLPVRFLWNSLPCDNDPCRQLCNDEMCVAKNFFVFHTTGIHNVTIQAYNSVSNLTKIVDIEMFPGLDNVEVELVNIPTVYGSTRFLMKENGNTMETANVYFNWEFGESSTLYFTNSPIVEAYFNHTGNLSALVEIINPVARRFIDVSVYVQPSTEATIQLLHDLYVTPGSEVTFDLKGPLIGWTELHVTYEEDGVSEVHDGVTHRWNHTFVEVGTQQVTASLVGPQGTTIETVTSYVSVQEPITDLVLSGPSMLVYEEYEKCLWTASTSTGTNILYNWTLEKEDESNSALLTLSEYEIDIPYPEIYTLHVEAFNDVTRQPLTASFPFVVHNVTDEDVLLVKLQVGFQIIGNLVGQQTHIYINVTGYPDFVLEINYGDGETETVYSSDPVVIATSTFNFKVFCSHVFTLPGRYDVMVNVSNKVSSDIAMETFIPISNITLTTRSPWILRTMSRVTVRAVVTGGEDLVFKWNFSDPFQKPNSTKTNWTSVATHSYGMSGTYLVMFNVTGRNYPPPGVYVTLEQAFLVVDPIDTVKLYPSCSQYNCITSAPFLGNRTASVLFTAKSSGSHVTFMFDYGDGTRQEVPGSQLSHMNVDMTMYADGIHTYTSIGEYKVNVTAENPLSNKTVELPASFWVQVPPSGLAFCDKRISSYSGKVGEAIPMCAKVDSGTNVTFDWKLGDQTDLVKKGPQIKHKYMSPGTRKVYVTAHNHVYSETIQIKVYINHEIQSVEVVPEFDVVSMKEQVRFSVVIKPNMTARYNWKFEQYGKVKTFTTIQNYVDYGFVHPGGSTVTVTADNHINRVRSPKLDVYVHQPIRNSEIVIVSEPSQRLVNRSITVKHIAYLDGTDVNLTWTFGDGSSKIVSNHRHVEHIYNSVGVYNISLVARNPVSMETVHRMLFVLDEPYCTEPDVKIRTGSINKVLYSRYFTLEADVEPDCNLTSNVGYHWSIDGQSNLKNYQMRKKILVLPPRTLSYGFHNINIKVDMLGTIVYSSKSIRVEVVPSPLVAKIVGGVYRRLRLEDAIIVNGSLSYDPDTDSNRSIRYEWKCEFVADDGKHGDFCIRDNTHVLEANATKHLLCNLSLTSSVLKIPRECLKRASNYTFELTVYARGRIIGSTSQTISLENENSHSLDVKIIRPFNSQDLVNNNRKLSFYVECSNCSHEGNTYEWSVRYLAGYDIFDLARAHDALCVEMDGSNYLALSKKRNEKNGTSIEMSELETNDDEVDDVDIDDNLTDDDDDDDNDVDGSNDESDIGNNKNDLFNGVADENSQSSLYESDIESSTSNPLHISLIEEGKSDIESTRRTVRRRPLYEGDDEPTYPLVKENKESQRRDPIDIGEEENTAGRGLHMLPKFKEGEPGESGSSGGRQYVIVTETGTDRAYQTFDPNEQEGLGSGTDALDKVVGDKIKHGRQLSQLELPMVRVNLPKDQTSTGLDRPSLVIKPGFLKQGLTYFIDVKVKNEDTGYQGEATSSFVVNKSPVYGRCSIKPESGIELNSEFSVACFEWTDKHKPLRFEASYSLDKNGDQNLIYRGVNDHFSFHLPAGKPENDFNVYVYIALLDALLAKTTVCSITVQVTPKTVTDDLGIDRAVDSDSELIYDEVVSPDGALQRSIAGGNNALSKVYITYLATWLNKLNNSTNSLEQADVNTAAYTIEKSNASYIIDDTVSKQYRTSARRELLTILEELSIRDEAELVQSAKALSLTTTVADELDLTSLDLALSVLKSVCYGAQTIYNNEVSPTGELVERVVRTSSAIIQGIMIEARKRDTFLENMYKLMIQEVMDSVERLVLNELKFHVYMEDPIISDTEYFSIWASRHSPSDNQTMSIGKTQFKIPSHLGTNQDCLFSHMTSYRINPYGFKDRNKIQSVVGGLTLYNCEGHAINVDVLQPENEIRIDLPNIQHKTLEFPDLILQKWAMNVHQFNVTLNDLYHALHIVVELVPVRIGRLFPISVLLSFMKAPTPEYYSLKYNILPGENKVDIFLPAKSFNDTGEYYIGIVDSTYNSGRLRPGEVTKRNYTLKLWWGQCLYWNVNSQVWLPDGCNISQESTLEVTKCSCNHLTSFGGRFELVPNKLSFTDMEGFFSLNRNPVTLTFVCIILTLYCILMFLCYQADLHDNRKGGIVYLLDNSPMDQQKFEITVETGCWKGAGSTAKISVILHGEEGMSETRELISEDDRPMFERNSRDKFILSLPDSIGKIWKIQVWHNNFGPAPSWYLSRVIVRDLNTGSQYTFVCEKWLAVEEQDGKVEREFMVLDNTLQFTKVYKMKAWEYMADFHVWMSLITCPPYSGFMRTERLTLCLTMLMAYMCLNAVWYKMSVTEYRGEFGLLDLSWRNLTVGAICCAVVIPVGRFLEFLFRRSKPKHASNCHTKDEASDWEPDYPSGKPNEQESEDSSEQVQPIMTYSLLDQSILNWPNIQTWAQKQWMKRQQSGRSIHDSHSGNSSNHSGHHHGSNGSTNRQGVVNSVDLSVLNAHGFSELDQASSGFEDCSSLIRPKASVDSTHTTAAPSVNESTRVHKPQSLPDSLRISTKLPSESDYVKTSKAPSISSSGSNKSSMLVDRKRRRLLQHVYLPYWCRYVVWILCFIICVGCATVTIMYGYRFGVMKSTLWLQSLYFSLMICIFFTNPILILIAVGYTAWLYRKDPNNTDNYSFDIFNHEKAKQDLIQWKKQLETWDEGEALERGVAARQRSRYLRFARPPQEKQLIEARKQVLKEKRALTILRETLAFILSFLLLFIMANGKDGSIKYNLNTAVKNIFLQSGPIKFNHVQSIDQWYMWAEQSLLHSIDSFAPLYDRNRSTSLPGNLYMIGHVQFRQQRAPEISCSHKLPYVHSSCLSHSDSTDQETFGTIQGLSYKSCCHGDFMFGRHGVYDGSGFIMSLNNSRHEAIKQLTMLRSSGWLDRRTIAMIVELTLFNSQSNLFTSVKLLAERSTTGVVFTDVKITSTELFRYITGLDNILLACELLFFVLMMLSVKTQALLIINERRRYFSSLWNNLSFLMAIISLIFCGCFIYRFVIVAETVENLRSSYYERYVSVSFITFWDNVLQSSVAVLLFLYFIKSLRLLRFNKQFAAFGEVYRKARREIVIFSAMFFVILAAYTSLGHALFGSLLLTYSDLWHSLMGVTALLARSYDVPEFQSQPTSLAANVYMFTLCVFGIGFLMAYMIAVLTHQFKVRKRRRLLAFSGLETITFYWTQFQLWTGLRKPEIEEEPVIILPPEFTMAEIEYQVDELLFRMNALTGSHGLPEKPTCYLTDSDCAYGGGDDGISSAGSETGPVFLDDRLEQRVQKIEDNLCSQEPFLAQLFKFDSIGADDLTQEKEKQLRSHLELEIFRQLQIQRQDLKSPTEESPTKGSNCEQTESEVKEDNQMPQSPGQGSTSSDEQMHKQKLISKPTKPRRTRSSLKVQTLQDLLTKSTHEMMESHENSSSNPESPHDKLAFTKINKPLERVNSKKLPWKHNSSSSSSEKISPDLSTTHVVCSETENIKKPTKPTFLHSRESSLSDCPKGSPILKMRALGSDKGLRSDVNPLGLLESSSGSEQDTLQLGKKMFGRRSLRKTKSRGKGKGPDSLEPALVLDEIEGEEAVEMEDEMGAENAKEDNSSNQQCSTKGDNYDKLGRRL